MTSEKRWRKIFGPIAKRPWEVWPFVACCLAGPFFSAAFLGAALWGGIGFWRLAQGHRLLWKAAANVMQRVGDAKTARAILVRLTDAEIRNLAGGREVGDDSLRWRLIRLIYWRQ
jgi:hypothetical protein